MENIRTRLVEAFEKTPRPDRSAIQPRFSVWIEWGGEMLALRELGRGEVPPEDSPIVWIEHDGTLERRGFW